MTGRELARREIGDRGDRKGATLMVEQVDDQEGVVDDQ
jgi:hypothetical protein